MALVPNDNQIKIIKKNGYDHHYWLVKYEDDSVLVIVHKYSGDTKAFKK